LAFFSFIFAFVFLFLGQIVEAQFIKITGSYGFGYGFGYGYGYGYGSGFNNNANRRTSKGSPANQYRYGYGYGYYSPNTMYDTANDLISAVGSALSDLRKADVTTLFSGNHNLIFNLKTKLNLGRNNNSALAVGDVFKVRNLSAIYFLGSDNKRHVFPNNQTFLSWYPDFSNVKIISQAQAESYPLAANITIRPGSYLVKRTGTLVVYAVEPGGNLRNLVSQQNAIDLYGALWAQKVLEVNDTFLPIIR
jgi:hypothetical protein